MDKANRTRSSITRISTSEFFSNGNKIVTIHRWDSKKQKPIAMFYYFVTKSSYTRLHKTLRKMVHINKATILDYEINTDHNLLLFDTEHEQFFNITSVTRQDIAKCCPHLSAKEIAAITDKQMQAIADHVEDTFVSGTYWDDLEFAVSREI